MRREFARAFYSSGAWKRCRKDYAKSVGNVCERCIKNGVIRPIDEVHHKIALTPENINDPMVTLCWDNLEGLCEKCHKSIRKKKKRYFVAKDGELVIQEAP